MKQIKKRHVDKFANAPLFAMNAVEFRLRLL